MSTTFKGIAYKILHEAGKPMHSRDITRIALEMGLGTGGRTPEATMNAQLVVDINTKGEKSKFIKTGPSTFAINPELPAVNDTVRVTKEFAQEKNYPIPKGVSTKQKGDIAEARISELITLYGESSLSCYKPISDDEGIDLIVKRKGELKPVFIQVKSRFISEKADTYKTTVKENTLQDNHSMFLVFCLFNIDDGDLWRYLWLVPATDFIERADEPRNGRYNSEPNTPNLSLIHISEPTRPY